MGTAPGLLVAPRTPRVPLAPCTCTQTVLVASGTSRVPLLVMVATPVGSAQRGPQQEMPLQWQIFAGMFSDWR